MFMRSRIQSDHMVIGTGIDIVENERFESWTRSSVRLSKVFSQKEIVHYLNTFGDLEGAIDEKVLLRRKAAYWAARFAAKEAFYKALSVTLLRLRATRKPLGLFFVCENIEIVKGTWDVPTFKVCWRSIERKLGKRLPRLHAHLSLSHEKRNSVASVTISL